MKGKLTVFGLTVLAVLFVSAAMLAEAQEAGPQGRAAPQAAPSTAFTYQGRLAKNGTPVSSTCDLQFGLWDALSGGAQLGVTQTVSDVPVSDGYFTVLLNEADQFGASNFDGQVRYLGVTVQCSGDSGWSGLDPRQPLTGAPYALSTGALRGRPITTTAPGLNQVLKWNGSAWAPAVDETGGGGASWSLTGNGGTNPSANFLGTTDGVSLTLRVSNTVGFRLAPGAGGGTPNVIGGYAGNVISATVAGGTIAGGGAGRNINRVTANYATVGGGTGNQASGTVAMVGGGAANQTSGDYATVGGGYQNQASGVYATVGGGKGNIADDDSATVGGGSNNNASYFATVGGGLGNTAGGPEAFVGGGYGNTANDLGATVGGGEDNTASGYDATVGGGSGNTASGDGATVGGGGWDGMEPYWLGNAALGPASTIGGGMGNTIVVTGEYATIGGGFTNAASGHAATVGGGYLNAAGDNATVAGGMNNTASGVYATVSGGSGNTASGAGAFVGGGGYDGMDWSGNQALGPASTIGGGYSNENMGDYGVIAGGYNITVTGNYATVGGGGGNTASGGYATVGGGEDNTASSNYPTVGGGYGNTASGSEATVGGGGGNTARGNDATVGGGFRNQASGYAATVGGGYSNKAITGTYTTVGGGYQNQASGNYATVPGGANNTAQGDWSFAAGRRAKANSQGCFIWGDSTAADVACDIANAFIIRASGGVTMYTNSGLTSGSYLAAGGSSWNSVSNRALKENSRPVDTARLLARLSEIEISTWNYTAQDAAIRHIGPMADDFNGLVEGLGGEGAEYINTLDADGVALAAAQGLYDLSQEQAARIQELEAQNADLEARVAALEQAQGQGTSAPSQIGSLWSGWPALVVVAAVAGAWAWRRRAGGV